MQNNFITLKLKKRGKYEKRILGGFRGKTGTVDGFKIA